MNIPQEQAQPAIDHMNEHHADANIVYVRAWGGIKDAVESVMTAITNKYMLFDVMDASGKKYRDVKVEFENELSEMAQAHKVLVDMVEIGRKKLGVYTAQQISGFVDDLVEKSNIVYLATADRQGQPAVEYTQFVGDQNRVYVMLTELTQLCTNILSDHSKCSVMFLQNEQDAEHLAALERFTSDAVAIEIPYETELFQKILEQLIANCGDIYKKMANMADFRMFELNLKNKARYIKGFGLIF